MRPLEIKRDGGEGLIVTWSDQTVSRLSSKLLRANCPSADAKAKRGDKSHEQPLSQKGAARLSVVSSSLEEELFLKKIWPVGNYAIAIEWADGHNTGIYSFNLLRTLAEEAEGED